MSSDISREFATAIKAALSKDGYTAKNLPTADGLKSAYITAELKRIKRELDAKRDAYGRPLSDAEKERILRETAEELGAERRTAELQESVKAASNDSYLVLVTEISDVIKDAKPAK